MASFQHPYREIQDIPEDRELLSPNSAVSPHSPNSPFKARRPSIETVYHTPEKPLEVRTTDRWEQPGRKLDATPTQRYEKFAQRGLDDAYVRMRKSYSNSLVFGFAIAALDLILAASSIAVTDPGVLQNALIWLTSWTVTTAIILVVLFFLSRTNRELARRALICHLVIHVLCFVTWLATAAAVVDLVVNANPDSYTRKLRRGAIGGVGHSININGLVPTAAGIGFAMMLSFGLKIYRVSVLLRHAMI